MKEREFRIVGGFLNRLLQKVAQTFVCATFLVFAPVAIASTYQDQLIATAIANKIHELKSWRKILFYIDNVLQGSHGLFDSPKFYLSPIGHKDPEQELKAAIRAFFADPSTFKNDNFHPICAYPRRFQYLSQHLSIDRSQLPQVNCQLLDDWRAQNDYERLSVVFSSYYPDNPASMFGHTFLRLHREKANSGNSGLLDISVNFSAFPTTDNPLLYSLSGVLGFFPGRYQILPYFFKVQEYNNAERRDLWEYELDFSPEEIRQLLLAVWELGSNQANYFYFDDNCSAILLTLLDSIKPDLELHAQMPPWIIPSETLRAVTQSPGLVRNVAYYPSIMTKFRRRYADLSKDERDLFDRFLAEPNPNVPQLVTSIPASKRAKVLDTLVDYIDFEDRVAGSEVGKGFKDLRQNILVSRSKVKDKPLEYTQTPHHERPDLGHKNAYIGLGFGLDSRGDGIYQFLWRPALHELIAAGQGYPPGLEIGFFHTNLRFDEVKKSIYLQEYTLLKVWSLPTTPWIIRKPAWTLDVSSKAIRACGENNHRCQKTFLQGGAGATLPLFNNKVVPYILGGGEIGTSQMAGMQAYGGPGVLYGIWFDLFDRVKSTVKVSHFKLLSKEKYRIAHEISADVGISVTSDFEIAVRSQWTKAYQENLASFNFYF